MQSIMRGIIWFCASDDFQVCNSFRGTVRISGTVPHATVWKAKRRRAEIFSFGWELDDSGAGSRGERRAKRQLGKCKHELIVEGLRGSRNRQNQLRYTQEGTTYRIKQEASSNALPTFFQRSKIISALSTSFRKKLIQTHSSALPLLLAKSLIGFPHLKKLWKLAEGTIGIHW